MFIQPKKHDKSEEVTKITWTNSQKDHVINYLENTGQKPLKRLKTKDCYGRII